MKNKEVFKPSRKTCLRLVPECVVANSDNVKIGKEEACKVCPARYPNMFPELDKGWKIKKK